MHDLKTAIANEAEARAHMLAVNEKLVEATRARDATAADLAALQSNLEAAAQKHAEAVAAVELGDADVDTDITAAELAKARAALADEADLLQKLRTQTAIVDALEARYLASHVPLNEAVADMKAARIAVLEARAREAHQAAKDSVVAVTTRMAELLAAARALEANGGRWSLGTFDPVLALSAAQPDAAAVELMAASLARELDAA